jgi:hypothetical protein
MFRCDDIFIDSDAIQFEKICQAIRKYDFHHVIGITPLGEGKKLWTMNGGLWKIHFLTKYGFFVNYRIRKMMGEKCIEDNEQLLKILGSEFSKYGAIPALHGLHHYKYSSMPQQKVFEELSRGTRLLQELFNEKIEIFVPPFNAWNRNTEYVCKKLNLSLDKCRTGFDRLIKNMNDYQIEMLAKEQSSVSEVYYHPHRLTDLNKFELYLRSRRKYR